jgi:hypothetical protein
MNSPNAGFPNAVGFKLIDTNGSEWRVVAYQGDTYRAVNLSHNYLSEAEGRELFTLMHELVRLEEIMFIEVKSPLE